VAALFAIAAFVVPVLAFAQGGGGTGGGTGSGSSPGGGTPPGPAGGPGTTGDTGGGRGLAWIVVLLAIAVAIWLFTRRRTGQIRR